MKEQHEEKVGTIKGSNKERGEQEMSEKEREERENLTLGNTE